MKYYVTTRQYQKPIKTTWEDVIQDKTVYNQLAQFTSNSSGTVTKVYNEIPKEILSKINVPAMIEWLKKFNEDNKELFEKDRESLYRHFKIKKATGGYRPIDAPCYALQSQLRKLNKFITEIGVLHHTSTFAYVKKRNTVKCVQRHVSNKSNWYLKTDISSFFPSTTLEFVMFMARMIFPLSEICKVEEGYTELKKALSLAFLNGGLPQGTCMSPSIATWCFLPIDFKLFNMCVRYKMIYTRYADDIHISAKEHFPKDKAIKMIQSTLKEFNTPYILKKEKTHYGSVHGQNWILGLMASAYNDRHTITVGYKNKAYFKAKLCSFILDTKNCKRWDVKEVHKLRGLLSYYEMIEADYFKKIKKTAEKKWDVNLTEMFKGYFA